MTKIAEKCLTIALSVMLLILLNVLGVPALLFAVGPKSDIVGKPQRIQDSGKFQKVMYALLQKANVQHKLITDWHQMARLENNKKQAKNHGQSTKAIAAAASKRACQIQLAMARTPEDITVPGCRATDKFR
ncbi:MAG: hypothetical protein ACLQPD_32590 [Desulfomonilaceae bacterium]